MKYFADLSDESQLKTRYRTLLMQHHPDKGGSNAVVQHIIDEYNTIKDQFYKTPQTLFDVKVGNRVYVNGTKSIVTWVDQSFFRARSTVSGREALFSKKTGLCLSNKKFKAVVWGLN